LFRTSRLIYVMRNVAVDDLGKGGLQGGHRYGDQHRHIPAWKNGPDRGSGWLLFIELPRETV
jgi:hypothetical protein